MKKLVVILAIGVGAVVALRLLGLLAVVATLFDEPKDKAAVLRLAGFPQIAGLWDGGDITDAAAAQIEAEKLQSGIFKERTNLLVVEAPNPNPVRTPGVN